MIDLKGQEGELSMTIQITRAATGEVEEYELVGKIIDIEQDKENGDNTLDSGA